MQYIIVVVFWKESVYTFKLELKEKSGPPKIVMQMNAIKRAITEDLYFQYSGIRLMVLRI